MAENSRLVYSSNPTLNQKCAKCKEAVSECVCVLEATLGSNAIVAVLRIEKSGRGGKTVTVIDRLPKSEAFLKELCTELKKKCGSGGSIQVGGESRFSPKPPSGITGNYAAIEIQGDKRETIRSVLSKKGMTVKG